MDRQRIHVATQQHGAAGPATVQPGDEAAGRLAVANIERQAGKRRLQLGGRLVAVEAQFRIGMDRSAQRDGGFLFGFRGLAPDFQCHSSSRWKVKTVYQRWSSRLLLSIRKR